MDDNVNSDCVLRDAAEDKLRRSQNVSSELKDKTPEAIIHELHVHQIEPERQNEELKRVQLELEEFRDKYQDVNDLAPCRAVTLYHGDGSMRLLQEMKIWIPPES